MIIVNVFDPKDWDIWYSGILHKAKSLRQWQSEENADIVYNLAFFNMATKDAINKGIAYDTIYMVKAKGQQIGDYVSYTEDVKIDNDNVCSGWRTAIHNGVVTATDASTKRSRNMHGWTADGRYIHVQTTNGYTEKYIATYTNDYIQKNYKTTVRQLIIQDAGGSTGEYTKAKLHFAPEGSRPCPTVVCLRCKAKVKAPFLKKGMKGEEVRLLQQILGGIETDGSFGNGTRNRLISAQKALGLTPDGVAGDKTLTKLGFR